MPWWKSTMCTNTQGSHRRFPLVYKIGIWCIFIIFLNYNNCQSKQLGVTDFNNSTSVLSREVLSPVVNIHQNYSTNTQHNAECDESKGKVVHKRSGYPQDPECRHFHKCLYEDFTFEQTPLVSFPGSGNTWTRHLIELASGIYTGSIYTDFDLLSRGFVGEKEPPDAGSTIVQKMHIHFSKDLNVSRAILLIRDPYKAIVSFVQYLESGHLGLASAHTFKKKEWPAYILRKTYEWISLAKSWIENPVDLLILHYETLQGKEGVKELQKVCTFLQIKCHNLHSKCFQNHKEGSFHRSRKFFVQPEFPNWVRKKVNGGINYLNTLLIQHGHPPLPLDKYQFQSYK